jgi:hypothetical protein
VAQEHPDWVIQDAAGKRAGLRNNSLAALCPALPEVQSYELLVVRYPAWSTSFIACQVRKDLSCNPDHLSPAARFFLTTWEDLPEEITHGSPRPKMATNDEPELTATSLIRAGSRFGTSH